MYIQGLNFSIFIFFHKNEVFTVTFQTKKNQLILSLYLHGYVNIHILQCHDEINYVLLRLTENLHDCMHVCKS